MVEVPRRVGRILKTLPERAEKRTNGQFWRIRPAQPCPFENFVRFDRFDPLKVLARL